MTEINTMSAVPAGWKLVPINLSRTMLLAAAQVDEVADPKQDMLNMWAVMLSAAPQPPTAQPADHCADASKMVQTTQPAEPDMPAICAALGFDPTNHHNAAKCPYCTPTTQPAVSDVLIRVTKQVLADLQAKKLLRECWEVLQDALDQATQPQQSTPVQQSAAMPEFEVVANERVTCRHGFASYNDLVRLSEVTAAWFAAQPAEPAKQCPTGDKCKHGAWCSETYCQELCVFISTQPQQSTPVQPAMQRALKTIADWDLPKVLDRQGIECSYEALYGSNGARDYIRALARAAINPTGGTTP